MTLCFVTIVKNIIARNIYRFPIVYQIEFIEHLLYRLQKNKYVLFHRLRYYGHPKGRSQTVVSLMSP